MTPPNKFKLGLVGIVLAGGISGIFGKSYGQNNQLNNLKEDSLAVRKTEISDKIDEKQESSKFFIKKVYSDSLRLNSALFTYYATKKNEEQGIEDIRKINNSYEEAWLYLPEKQIWYEIGSFSGFDFVYQSSYRVKKALEENKDAKELIFYHNHPGKRHNRPSTKDLWKLIESTLNYPEYKITEKIIADKGIVEYSLKSKTKKILENKIKIDEEYYYDIGGEYYYFKNGAFKDKLSKSKYVSINFVRYTHKK